jgi:hypothetical protein
MIFAVTSQIGKKPTRWISKSKGGLLCPPYRRKFEHSF